MEIGKCHKSGLYIPREPVVKHLEADCSLDACVYMCADEREIEEGGSKVNLGPALAKVAAFENATLDSLQNFQTEGNSLALAVRQKRMSLNCNNFTGRLCVN